MEKLNGYECLNCGHPITFKETEGCNAFTYYCTNNICANCIQYKNGYTIGVRDAVPFWIIPTVKASKCLWEILVPTVHRDGRPIHTRFHRVWDQKVKAISNGLTIFHPVKGQWINNKDGGYFEERMIPVRFIATKEQVDKIIDFTIKYYDQEAVMCYKISDQVIIRYKNEKKSESVIKLKNTDNYHTHSRSCAFDPCSCPDWMNSK